MPAADLEEKSLEGTLLTPNGQTRLIIPVYQRGYDWQSEHIDALWNDVLDHSSGGKYENQNHFFGFIWTEDKTESNNIALPRYEIVDGQQRITTVLMLLTAMRDFCYERKITQNKWDRLTSVIVRNKTCACGKKTHYFMNTNNINYFKAKGYSDKNIINTMKRKV